ncbi:NAD-dependent epimerase/dehydratase family protein [Roseospira visakhapatnamensis]|uniref:Nucleoside-diphosphate-sugar epimerase n=1 Tax=Roseospira visakhapatnamensis TaxID=390880 RepID=A0A7W6W8F4_9PROT|nr:NAD-dependent epimerase/dehydratase family protein [Roseospira visakhapatnamensis]MBB4264950.1 nucleoside-diphosphate-sugar epimerase [Roseospira visakhapatnamensis]
MRALVLGTGGMIGDAVARALAARGIETFGASRAGPLGSYDGWCGVRADRADPTSVRALLNAHAIDVLVDIVAYASAETARLLTAIDGRVAQYVLVSSLDVYRNYGLLHGLETGVPDPGPLDENAPLRLRLYPYRGATRRPPEDPLAWLDDYDKIPIEEAVRGLASAWTILRLPMVYGPGDRQRRFRWAIEPMLAGAGHIDVAPAWLAWTTTFGFIDNVAAAIALTVGQSRAFGATFNVVDTPPMSHRLWLEHLRAVTGWRGVLRSNRTAAPPVSGGVTTLDLTVPLAVSGQRLVDHLSYVPPVDVCSTLARTIAAERSQGL